MFLVLVMLGSVVSPVMAAKQDKILSKGQLEKIWDEWPHKDGEVGILWMNTVHQTIAEKAGDAMNMGQPYLASLSNIQ